MKYGQDNLGTRIDFQGERTRGSRQLANDRIGRPDFVRDTSTAEVQLDQILFSRQPTLASISERLAAQGPEGQALALMLVVAVVGAGAAAALTSHPVSADGDLGYAPLMPDAVGHPAALLGPECDTAISREEILAVDANGQSTEVSFNDGLKALPPDPTAANLDCRTRQISAGLREGQLGQHDVEWHRHLRVFFGENAQILPKAEFKDWQNQPVDPTGDRSEELGLVLVAPSRKLVEPLLEQVSWYHARANGYEARPGSPSRGAIIAYTLLNDIFGFAGEFDSTIRSTCVTHQDRAQTRFNQPTVIIDRAVWKPRIAVGGERSIFKGNPELRSSDARIGMLFREIIGKSNVDLLIRSLRAEKLDAVAAEIAKGKFLVVAGFDPESEDVDFPGLKKFAAGDRDPAHGVGDGAWMVRCGPAAPKPTETPTPTQPPQPTARPPEATQPPGQPPEIPPSPPEAPPPPPPEKGPDPYDTGGSVEDDQTNRENKGTGGTGGQEDTKPNEP